MGKIFHKLEEALLDVLEYERGNKELRSKTVFIPDHPKDYKAKDIKQLRGKLHFSQRNFAAWLNVSLNTVQAWEQGVRHPNHSVLRLLEIFDKDFSLIEKLFKRSFQTKSRRMPSRTKTKVH